MVIAVTLLGVVSCGVQRVSEVANARTATMNNLSQCAKAVHLCQDQFGKYPPYFGTYGPKTTPFTFHVHLLPFVDQGPLYANPDAKSIVGTYLSTMDPTITENGANACNFPVNIRLYYNQGGAGKLTSEETEDLIYPKMPCHSLTAYRPRCCLPPSTCIVVAPAVHVGWTRQQRAHVVDRGNFWQQLWPVASSPCPSVMSSSRWHGPELHH